jgi:hypothetical protein
VDARPLDGDQRALLDFLLSRGFPGRTELIRQAETVLTAGSSCSCGCPSFSLVADRTLPAAAVGYADRMVSDAHGTDPGGNEIGVLLFTEDGYLFDVEIYSIAGDEFAGLPRPDSLKLSEWSERDHQGTRRLLNP